MASLAHDFHVAEYLMFDIPEVSIAGVSKNGWFIYVYFTENPNPKWMMTGGTPMT